MNSFESALSAALVKNAAGKVLLAAISGGADSTAMLCGLAELRDRAGFALHCAHVEHGLRPPEESQGDASFVEGLCEKLMVPCRVISIPRGRIASYAASHGTGIEAAARVFRYRALLRERARVQADWLLTAHTRDDALENLLMRILRGSGPAGLSPMPRQRGRILRPLLELTRQDMLQYLEGKNIPHRMDSTNNDNRFFRNRVRNKLIPLLDNLFPFWRVSLLALAETQSLTADFLAGEARARLPWEGRSREGAVASLRLSEEAFLAAPLILREEAIFAAADMLAASLSGGKPGMHLHNALPRRAALRRAVQQGGVSADLGPVRLERKNGYIEVKPARRKGGERGFSLLINECGLYTLKLSLIAPLPAGRIYIRAVNPELKDAPQPRAGHGDAGGNAPCFEASSFPLVFRNHRKGDRLYRGGHARSISGIMGSGARSGCAGIITACDTRGIAAFIAVGRDGELMVKSRDGAGSGAADNAGAAAVRVYAYSVFGGKDA